NKITNKDFEEAIIKVRESFIEADVVYEVVDELIDKIKEKVIGEKVVNSVNGVQTIIKIIQDELTEILGKDNTPLIIDGKKPLIYMVCGLQGVGKTTTTAKLAYYLKNKKLKVMVVSVDVYRYAAINQLKVMAEKVGVECANNHISDDFPDDILIKTLELVKKENYDCLIIDTAGRLQIDVDMIDELERLKKLINPVERLLVVDAMMGQQSMDVVKAFNEVMDLTGTILTRMEGDARGGAAISMKCATGCPIKFIGIGEKENDLDVFHPERMAGRILNMGDVVSLVEKAKEAVGEKHIDEVTEKAKQGKFDFNDLLMQFQMLNKLGGISSVLKMIPGLSSMMAGKMDSSLITRNIAMINSMTKKERANPELLSSKSRCERIAKGAGLKPKDVATLLTQFHQAKSMIKNVANKGVNSINKSDIMKMFSPGGAKSMVNSSKLDSNQDGAKTKKRKPRPKRIKHK
ncbi:MAG: signal recognition particle protein, partial [Anaplasmataceae bacterium]|nr:signal recognition particle protein [Anaplasmataceae bacterium]